MLKTRLTLAAAALAALLPAAHAQSSEDELRRLLAAAMPPAVGKDNSELVKKLQSIKIDGAISKNFDPAKVSKQLFGRTLPTEAADCRTATTSAKEADPGLCQLAAGQRDDPTGAYTLLAYSKNIGQGNIKFIKRGAFKVDGTPTLNPVKLTDASAYEQALKFADLVGVPRSEIPAPPAAAKNPYPVRTLALGSTNEAGGGSRIELQKVVSLPRAFAVPGGLYKDANGNELNHVIAPGNALIVLDDTGVQAARITDWFDAKLDPKIDPRYAKSVDQLLDEIAQDLHNEGVRQVGSLSILISLRKALPNPDDPDSPNCPACVVLRPALQVIVSQVGKGVVSPTQVSHVAPGLIREYDLVDQVEAEVPAR